MDPNPRISPAIPVNLQTIRNLQTQQNARQVESEEDLAQYFEVNPLVMTQRFRTLRDLKEGAHLTHDLKETEVQEELKISAIEKEADDAATYFEQGNEELGAQILLMLRSRFSGKPTIEEILEATLATYTDRSLADEALDFLIQTAATPELMELFQEAKKRLNDEYGPEIRAGRNMGAEARSFAKEGLGSPVSLRALYKDIINNPREAIVLFDQLTEKFPYAKLITAISFLLKSLGQDFRSRGPSIPRPELKRLIDEARSLQGILGVYRFFQSRMSLIANQFTRLGLVMPLRLNFEMLGRLFIKILGERFINPERILMTAQVLGISDLTAAEIIVFTQMRDALRGVAPRYFRNNKHREELLKIFIDTLEKLDKDQKEEEEKKKKK